MPKSTLPLPDSRRGAEPLGEQIGPNEIRFVRHYSASIERVWAALTTGESIATWLATPVHLDIVVGGAFRIAFNADDRMDGRIVELEAYCRLVLSWHEHCAGDSERYEPPESIKSLVTFALSPTASGGTKLIFTQRYIADDDAAIGLAAGWHAHLAALGALLDGDEAVDRAKAYTDIRPFYESRGANQLV